MNVFERIAEWNKHRADEKQRRAELAEVKWAVEFEIAKKALEDEKARFGDWKEFHFDSRSETDAFIKGLEFGLKYGDSVTRVTRVFDWWVKLNIKNEIRHQQAVEGSDRSAEEGFP